MVEFRLFFRKILSFPYFIEERENISFIEERENILEDTRIPRQVAFLANLSRDEDRNKSLVGSRRGAWMAEACRETTKFSLASKAEGIMRRDGRRPTEPSCVSPFRARFRPVILIKTD